MQEVCQCSSINSITFYFQISCSQPSPKYFWGNHHMQNWFNNIANTPRLLKHHDYHTVKEFTLAIVRIEYANLYHFIQDLYSTFLMMEFFGKTQTETNILFIEAHPWTPFDLVWTEFFNSTRRVSSLPNRTLYKDLVWTVGGHDNSMSDFVSPDLPLINEFINFTLSTYQIKSDHKLNCQNISILFILRRDYIAHARNPTGILQRKISNENEILEALRKEYPGFKIQGRQIELMDMRGQIQLITQTDILIGKFRKNGPYM